MNLRIASFNLENFDESLSDRTLLTKRVEVLQPQLLRLKADILCLQEVHSQCNRDGQRTLKALEFLLLDTSYEHYHRAYTLSEANGQVYDQRNLIILSRFPIRHFAQYRNDDGVDIQYQNRTASLTEPGSSLVYWERPILHAEIDLGLEQPLHVVNLHLKSRQPTNLPGQSVEGSKWLSASGWAEGYFISTMKRVGQAVEVRRFVDRIFDADEQSWLAVCGDFNAELDEVPVMAICGDVSETRNTELLQRVMIPSERSLPEGQRYSFIHHGEGRMLDHILLSRSLWSYHQRSEIHNEQLKDESNSEGEKLFPDSDHAPLVAEFLV